MIGQDFVPSHKRLIFRFEKRAAKNGKARGPAALKAP